MFLNFLRTYTLHVFILEMIMFIYSKLPIFPAFYTNSSSQNSANMSWLDILLFFRMLYHKHSLSYLLNAMGISYEDSTLWSFSEHSTDEKLSMSALEAYISI